MGLFKEEVHVIEEFAKRQKQLYVDACDFGVRLTSDEKARLRDAVQSLRETVPSTLSKHSGYSGHGSYTTIFVPWEVDEGHAMGTKILITYWYCKRDGEHFEITFDRFAIPYADFERMH